MWVFFYAVSIIGNLTVYAARENGEPTLIIITFTPCLSISQGQILSLSSITL